MIIVLDRHTREKLFIFPGDTFAGKDLRTYNLCHADLSGYDLSACNMEGMDLEEIELSDTILIDANLKNTNLTEAILSGATMHGTQLNKARLNMTSFARAELIETDFSEAIFEGIVNFTEAIAIKTKFRKIRSLHGAIFWNTDCTDADFEGTDFNQVNLTDRAGVILKGTIFEHLSR